MAKNTRPSADGGTKKRYTVFITLDDATEAALVRFIADQRVRPERAAVGLTALTEFLTKEGYLPPPAGK